MHHDPAMVAHESIDGIVLMHGCDACILGRHLRLKLQEGGFPDLPRGIFNLDCLPCMHKVSSLSKCRLLPGKVVGTSAAKGHLAQDGSDQGRVWGRHKIWRQMLKFYPCSKLFWPLDTTSQVGRGVVLTMIEQRLLVHHES